ncbi:MAG: TrmJ/YjtD family RNA methyltransferase [Anaerolineae bacterium]
MTDDRLTSITTILVEPQSVDNVGATVRAMRNMGLGRLRLVRPAAFDWSRLLVIAHRCEELVAGIGVYDTLDDALADVVYAVGTTSRPRGVLRPTLDPRAASSLAIERAALGTVAFLFGREDFGLPNSALDRCHALLTIPTAPDYPSLNLAQAVLLVAYELRLASEAASPAATAGQRPIPASGSETEAMFAALIQAMQSTDFLIPSRADATIRALRALLLRAEPSAEEAALITAMARAFARSTSKGE